MNVWFRASAVGVLALCFATGARAQDENHAHRDHFMAASLDQPLQSSATLRMIFNKQYSHLRDPIFPKTPITKPCAKRARSSKTTEQDGCHRVDYRRHAER